MVLDRRECSGQYHSRHVLCDHHRQNIAQSVKRKHAPRVDMSKMLRGLDEILGICWEMAHQSQIRRKRRGRGSRIMRNRSSVAAEATASTTQEREEVSGVRGERKRVRAKAKVKSRIVGVRSANERQGWDGGGC